MAILLPGTPWRIPVRDGSVAPGAVRGARPPRSVPPCSPSAPSIVSPLSTRLSTVA